MTQWEAGSFEGSARATAQAAATATLKERLDWHESMLRVALANGSLQRLRDARQREVEASWAQGA